MMAQAKCAACSRGVACKHELWQGNGLCQACWRTVTPAQEFRLHGIYATHQDQWCTARHPTTGRPCWLETVKHDTECRKKECVKFRGVV